MFKVAFPLWLTTWLVAQPAPAFNPSAGDTVLLADGRTAELQFIGASPYYGESIERAYVIGGEPGATWSDYVLTSEIIGVL